ncbi:sigma-70 family RNA polymerase sigma factor [Bordetella genomosp. 12]|uniref:RNA polymerase subunit sigma n=1 Tax=Bordetella genomosp. 12 TaxID=463035 RepID=A0A261VFI4_9BORD|nr:sigma-70 family RNA polymerase sigma factor [Bordetella genomosp. 12]OZI72350.1 RNA polymerase subunit sigma [Bordetella genomosp. 12]
MSTTEFAGSRPRLEHLYAEHHGWLRTWLRRRLGNAFDAADLAHDTYLQLLKTGHLPEPQESRQHLVQIARCLAIDLHRRRKIEAAYLDALAQSPATHVPSEEARAQVIQTLMEVDRLLHSLPAKVRMALLWCKLDGLSYAEIAQRLGVSTSSVKKYIATALLACYEADPGQGA